MKQKIFILMLVIFLLPGLVACSSQNPIDGQTSETIGERESEEIQSASSIEDLTLKTDKSSNEDKQQNNLQEDSRQPKTRLNAVWCRPAFSLKRPAPACCKWQRQRLFSDNPHGHRGGRDSLLCLYRRIRLWYLPPEKNQGDAASGEGELPWTGLNGAG